MDRFCGEYISEWPKRQKHVDSLVQDARSVMRGSHKDWEWFREALKHPRKRWFIADLSAKAPVPKRFLPSMVQTAVKVECPSTNRHFIEPCVRSLVALGLLKALRRTMEEGTATEQTGAVNALYWVNSNPRNEDLADERAALLT